MRAKTVITILNYVWDISHNHDFDWSIEILIFVPCSLSQIWGFQCRTCCKKNQSPRGEEVRLRETKWINQKRIHWMFRTVEISMQRSKNSNFQTHLTLEVWNFQLVFVSHWNNKQTLVTQEKAHKYRGKTFLKHTVVFRKTKILMDHS